MANIAPEILKLLQRVRQLALDCGNVEESYSWRWRGFYRDLPGRVFLYANEKKDYLEVLLRLPLMAKKEILALPYIEEHKSMSERGWVTATVKTPEQVAEISPWLKVSYEFAKPFRTKEDALPGENTTTLEFMERVRQAANSFGEVEEYFPFGDRVFRSQQGTKKGQIFLYASEEDTGLYLAVRLPMDIREEALELDFVNVPKYIGHKGWVGAKVSNQEQLETVLAWIPISYQQNQPAAKTKRR